MEKANVAASAGWTNGTGKVFQAVLCHVANEVCISQTHNGQNWVWGGGRIFRKSTIRRLLLKICNFIHIQMALLPLRRSPNMLISTVGKEIHNNECNDIKDSQLPVFITNVIVVQQ